MKYISSNLLLLYNGAICFDTAMGEVVGMLTSKLT